MLETAVSPDLLRWLALGAFLALLFVVDLAIVRGRSGHMSFRLAVVASLAWLALALGFAAALLVFGQPDDAQAYLAGYLVEKSLSLDNVFVFLLVFSAFAVPDAERHRLLSYGIVGALVLRVVFILVGAALLAAASWTSWLFAAVLLWTAWRMWTHRHDHDAEDALVARLRRRLRIAPGGNNGRLIARVDGRRAVTTAGAAMVAIIFVDILFAVDSVPAILAITTDPYLVIAANAFALLGLRPLFFLVAGLVERLYYLKAALAALLAFIAVKLAAGEVVGKIGPELSLPAIALILTAGVVASLLRERRMGRPALPQSHPTHQEV